MLSKGIKRIMKENEKYAKILAYYDETGVFQLEKVKRSFTLRKSTMSKLKELSKKKRKSMSAVVDSLVDEYHSLAL